MPCSARPPTSHAVAESLRDPDSTGVFLLIVPDRDTAEDIASYYRGCRIEKLVSDIEEPEARPPVQIRVERGKGCSQKGAEFGSVSGVSEESLLYEGIV